MTYSMSAAFANAILSVAGTTDAWDESKHPRKGGKFTNSDSAGNVHVVSSKRGVHSVHADNAQAHAAKEKLAAKGIKAEVSTHANKNDSDSIHVVHEDGKVKATGTNYEDVAKHHDPEKGEADPHLITRADGSDARSDPAYKKKLAEAKVAERHAASATGKPDAWDKEMEKHAAKDKDLDAKLDRAVAKVHESLKKEHGDKKVTHEMISAHLKKNPHLLAGTFDAAWNESLHPRKGGKFTSKGSGDTGKAPAAAKKAPAAAKKPTQKAASGAAVDKALKGGAMGARRQATPAKPAVRKPAGTRAAQMKVQGAAVDRALAGGAMAARRKPAAAAAPATHEEKAKALGIGEFNGVKGSEYHDQFKARVDSAQMYHDRGKTAQRDEMIAEANRYTNKPAAKPAAPARSPAVRSRPSTPAKAPANEHAHVEAAYDKAKKGSGIARLDKVREHLSNAGVPLHKQDALLTKAHESGKFQLMREDDQRSLTDSDRMNHLNYKGDKMHIMMKVN